MEQYISKSALVAEIKRRKDESWLGHYTKEKGIVFDITDDILSWIDTLEMKEVELTWEDVREICTQSVLVEIDLGGLVSDERHYTEVLKRYKAQKGEKV